MSVRDIIILGCSSQQPTRKRNHGAYLFRWNNEGLLFDPGEGTQRQFIFAEIAPPVVTRIFVSHFHGDHCLGLGSMLMRLNLDKVDHPIHCYYPASGKKHFDRLRYGCIYHENITVIEHPIKAPGLVEDDGKFRIEATFLKHGVDTIGWRITEADTIKYDKEKLLEKKVLGPLVKELTEKGQITIDDKKIKLEDVSWVRKGDAIAVILDSLYCQEAIDIAKNAKILLCESTFTKEHQHLADEYKHMSAYQAAMLAKSANVEKLILTHFSARYQDTSVFEKEAKEVFDQVILAEDLKKIPFPKKS